MNCREFDEIADSYLSDELLVETNHELIRHLENCDGCRNDLAQRRELRARLRSAVRSSSEIDPAFARRVRSQIHDMGTPVSSRSYVPAFAFGAMLIVGLLGLVIYFQPSLLPSLQSTNPKFNLSAALHDAIGNHEHCGLKHAGNPAKEISADYASLKSGFANLEFVEEHDCNFNGKNYSHTIFRNGKNIISILRSATGPGGESGVIVSTSLDSYQIAEFESGNHAVFVISDLTETENLQFARMILNKERA